jgi:hypothetical protein
MASWVVVAWKGSDLDGAGTLASLRFFKSRRKAWRLARWAMGQGVVIIVHHLP